jgi:hypothetical protein
MAAHSDELDEAVVDANAMRLEEARARRQLVEEKELLLPANKPVISLLGFLDPNPVLCMLFSSLLPCFRPCYQVRLPSSGLPDLRWAEQRWGMTNGRLVRGLACTYCRAPATECKEVLDVCGVE